ncbi:hypothetical protein ACVMB0_005591 [Bradyrhizobium sp. USDA 4451]
MAEQGTTPGGKRGYAGTWPPRAAAPVGSYLPVRASIWRPYVETLRQWARAEAGAGRLLPWVPVAFGTGIAFYFAAEHEPVLPVAASVAIALCLLALLLRRRSVFPAVVMLAAVAAGFAMATWKTARIAHGVLARPIYSVALTGFVETRDIREKTDRFVLRVVSMESQREVPKLERVRLSVKKGTAPDVGSFVELKARLMPPLGPQRPGSYDFGRDLYFQGIGASGFAMGAVKTREPPAAGGLALRYAAFMQWLRDAIDARIRTTLDGDQRAIATALLTGPARRDHDAGQRCDVHLGARPCAVDLRLPHGRGRGRGVFHDPRAAGAVSGTDGGIPDQEMGGGGCARRRGVLSAAVGSRGRDPAIVLHDGGGADRGDGRPPRHHLPHAGGGGADRARDCAGGAGASELPELECVSGAGRVFTCKPIELFEFCGPTGIGLREQKQAERQQKSGSDGAKSRKKSRSVFLACSVVALS